MISLGDYLKNKNRMAVLDFNLEPKYSVKELVKFMSPLVLQSVITHLQDIVFRFMRKKERVAVNCYFLFLASVCRFNCDNQPKPDFFSLQTALSVVESVYPCFTSFSVHKHLRILT